MKGMAEVGVNMKMWVDKIERARSIKLCEIVMSKFMSCKKRYGKVQQRIDYFFLIHATYTIRGLFKKYHEF